MAKDSRYTYDWPRPMVTVDAVVFVFFDNRAKILLINRKNEPFKGKWALPGGFVGIDEELQTVAARSCRSLSAKPMRPYESPGPWRPNVYWYRLSDRLPCPRERPACESAYAANMKTRTSIG